MAANIPSNYGFSRDASLLPVSNKKQEEESGAGLHSKQDEAGKPTDEILGIAERINKKTIDIGIVKTKFEDGEIIGDYYRYVRDKRFGVEPGFEAVKIWKATDDDKLIDPNHKFNQEALSYVEKQLADQNLEFVEAYREVTGFGDNEHFKSLDPDSKQKILKQFIQSPEIKTVIIKHLQNTFSKFTNLHYVKLNYRLEEKNGDQSIAYEDADKTQMVNRKVMLPTERAIGGSSVSKNIYRWMNAETIREKNWGAVKEYAANKLYNAMAFQETPTKIKMVYSRYEDGTPKLLLDGTHIKGPGGEKFETFRDQIVEREQIHYGRIIGNQIKSEKGELYDIDEGQLAAVGLSAGVLGDWDKVGPRGDNLGYVLIEKEGRKIAQIRNLDPGKAMPKQEGMSAANLFKRIINRLFMFLLGDTDVSRRILSNAAFEIPSSTLKEKILGGYRNFSIFHDTTMNDRVEAAKYILAQRGAYDKIFDELEKEFGATVKDDPALHFETEIKEMRRDFFERLEYLESVVQENVALSPEQRDVLDSLEKLTSPTLSSFKTKKGEAQPFVHLQIDLKNRKEWRFDAEKNQFYHQAKSTREANKMAQQLKAYLGTGNLSEKVKVEGRKVFFDISDSDFPNVHAAFEEHKVAKHKKQPLLPKKSHGLGKNRV